MSWRGGVWRRKAPEFSLIVPVPLPAGVASKATWRGAEGVKGRNTPAGQQRGCTEGRGSKEDAHRPITEVISDQHPHRIVEEAWFGAESGHIPTGANSRCQGVRSNCIQRDVAGEL